MASSKLDRSGADWGTSALDRSFDHPAYQHLPLQDRNKVTALIETLFRNLIAELKPGLIAEVGAFEADFSRQMKQAHPHATVLALEANPRVYEHFRAALEGSGVDYRHVAAGAQDGVVTLHIPVQIAGKEMPAVNRMGSLNVVALRDSRTTPVEVPLATLDSLLAPHPAGRRAALWIDVEGAIDQVLAGAQRSLAAADLIICELESRAVWNNQALASEIGTKLAALGFVKVARDCQKWFQHNAVFLRREVLAGNPVIAGLCADYVKGALALWRSFAPPKLFQFWDARERPQEVDQLMKSWEADAAFAYCPYTRQSAEALIAADLDEAVLRAFRACRIPAMQADLFRLCALYLHGGIYVDADIGNIGQNQSLFQNGPRGLLIRRNAAIANDLMVVHEPGDPLVQFALESAVGNIEQRLDGKVWDVTGPGILTRAFHRMGKDAPLFSGFEIMPSQVARLRFGFKWDLDYKKSGSHWTEFKGAEIYEG